MDAAAPRGAPLLRAAAAAAAAAATAAALAAALATARARPAPPPLLKSEQSARRRRPSSSLETLPQPQPQPKPQPQPQPQPMPKPKPQPKPQPPLPTAAAAPPPPEQPPSHHAPYKSALLPPLPRPRPRPPPSPPPPVSPRASSPRASSPLSTPSASPPAASCRCAAAALASSPVPVPFTWVVLWDLENMSAGRGASGVRVVKRLAGLLRRARGGDGVRDAVELLAMGNTAAPTLPAALARELQSSGVALMHVASRKPESADKVLLVHFGLALRRHPRTTGIAVVSGDGDFAYAISVARNLGFRTAVFHPRAVRTSPYLSNAPELLFSWDRDVLAHAQAVPERTVSEVTADAVSVHAHQPPQPTLPSPPPTEAPVGGPNDDSACDGTEVARAVPVAPTPLESRAAVLGARAAASVSGLAPHAPAARAALARRRNVAALATLLLAAALAAVDGRRIAAAATAPARAWAAARAEGLFLGFEDSGWNEVAARFRALARSIAVVWDAVAITVLFCFYALFWWLGLRRRRALTHALAGTAVAAAESPPSSGKTSPLVPPRRSKQATTTEEQATSSSPTALSLGAIPSSAAAVRAAVASEASSTLPTPSMTASTSERESASTAGIGKPKKTAKKRTAKVPKLRNPTDL